MNRSWLRIGSLAVVLTAGALLFIPDPASAQHRGGGGGGRGGSRGGGSGGWHGGSGWSGAWSGSNWHGSNWHGNNWHGNNWHGNNWGWWGPWWGWGWGLGYGVSNWGWGYPYRGYYGGYYPGDYYYSSDYYYPDYYYSAQAYPGYSYQSFYPDPYTQQYGQQQRMGPTTHVTVRVPAPNAQLFLNGVPTRQMGMVREFDTPPVEPGYTYTYEAKAQWMDQNGKQMEKTRTVRFQPGQSVMIDFNQPDTGTPTATTETPTRSDQQLPPARAIQKDRKDSPPPPPPQ